MHIALAVVSAVTLVGVTSSPASAVAGHPRPPTFSRGETTSLLAASREGVPGNGWSDQASISPDGRYAAFVSSATNLGNADDRYAYVFVRDLKTGTVRPIARGYDPVISRGGRFVVFRAFAPASAADTNGVNDVLQADLRTGVTRMVSLGWRGEQGNNDSGAGVTSDDGRYVAFWSVASNLVPGDTNNSDDYFVRDMRSGRTQRVSVDSRGRQTHASQCSAWGASISADGRLVSFTSSAPDLVPRDTNQASDIFVRDVRRGVTERVSVGPRGRQSTGKQGDCGSYHQSMSADGRFIAFDSTATGLVGHPSVGPSNSYVHDRRTGRTQLVALNSRGQRANTGTSWDVSISADGRHVAFVSGATNLAAGDTNNTSDVFRRDLRRGVTDRVSIGPDGQEPNEFCQLTQYALSGDGRSAVFMSYASNLVPGQTIQGQVYLRGPKRQ